jgi:hypothetical protein
MARPGSRYKPVVRFFLHGNKSSGFIKRWGLLEWLSKYWLLKVELAPRMIMMMMMTTK